MAKFARSLYSSLVAVAALSPIDATTAAPLNVGFAVAYSRNGGAPVFETKFYTDGSGASASASLGPGANISSRSQTAPWISRIGVFGDSAQGIQYGSALSVFAINNMVTGAPGATARVTYSFGFDGLFNPGDPRHYPVPDANANIPPQNFAFYLAAYLGEVQNAAVVEDAYGSDLRFYASNGELSLARVFGAPGYVNTIEPYNLVRAAGCPAGPCLEGGTFNDIRSITIDIPVGQSFYVSGYIGGATNGVLDFTHTLKLLSVTVPDGFGLVSDDGGALVYAGNGKYRLASVPEADVWALLVLGFGAVGIAIRRDRKAAAQGVGGSPRRKNPDTVLGQRSCV
jgi:hypothetical protein